jgi:hypothetical protein
MNNVEECKVESKRKDPLPESEIKVKSVFYDGTSCDFTITVKNVNNGMFYGMAKMFASYFACLKMHKPEGFPDIDQTGINNLKPIAIELFRELGKQDCEEGEKHGIELLEIWTNQAFQSLQSGRGISG